MSRDRDAYGASLLAELQGEGPISELVERDDGYLDVGAPVGRYFSQYSQWSVTERQGIRLARGRVLDVGAGAGRHALYLQKRGLDVTAIDASVGAVKVCRRRGVRRAVVLPIERAHTLRPASFDTVLLLGNNWGLLANPKKARVLLQRLYAATTSGGRLIAESTNPYSTTDEHHLAYHRRNRARGRLPGQLRIRVRYKRTIGRWFEYLLVAPREMTSILRGTGWRVRRILGRGEPNYIAVIEKG